MQAARGNTPVTRTTGAHSADHEGGWVAYGIGPLDRGPRGCRADGVVPFLTACGASLVGVGDKTRRDREGGWLDLLAERLDEIRTRETGPFGRVAERDHNTVQYAKASAARKMFREREQGKRSGRSRKKNAEVPASTFATNTRRWATSDCGPSCPSPIPRPRIDSRIGHSCT